MRMAKLTFVMSCEKLRKEKRTEERSVDMGMR